MSLPRALMRPGQRAPRPEERSDLKSIKQGSHGRLGIAPDSGAPGADVAQTRILEDRDGAGVVEPGAPLDLDQHGVSALTTGHDSEDMGCRRR